MKRRSFARLRRIATRIPTYFADAVDNPEWLVMFALGRVMPVRRAYRRFRAVPAPIPTVERTIFATRDAAAIATTVRTDGIRPALDLPEAITREIHDFALATPCYGNMDRRLEFLAPDHGAAEQQFGRPLLTGHYFDRVEQCPAMTTVRQDPLLHAVAAAYLGPRVRLAAARLWWSFPTRPREEDLHLASQDRFHFDLDDWQTLKFFFYLTDVDERAGPHVYIRGSHRQRLWRHQLTLLVGQPTDEVVAAYGARNVLSVMGEAGYGFAEDPFGFHMGTAPRATPRLMMEIAFGVSAASRRRFYGEPVVGLK
ncbi:MAG TPA: hypothetical protein VGV37_00420 [Aliidongia sp.]|uniref:hypothetical protein n=1 Tax=Aliidongia sp. TaxID=1914230 RepID=UPI002DDD4C9A|nr:hypothetical protein [Aliidongia sp.]HEV2672971.1 hypothetical protein [Aliidongia sp.]